MENRKRNVHLHVMVTPDELAAIRERMTEAGISNAGAYVRKMALNGYILHIDLAPVKELISLQRRCSNNLNQVAIHAHTYGVYPEEIDGLKRDYENCGARCQRCCGSFPSWWQSKTREAGCLFPASLALSYHFFHFGNDFIRLYKNSTQFCLR